MDDSLRGGHRELPKNTKLTLARLLAKRRGVRNSEYPPLLTEAQIVKWAKLHHKRTGKWPKENSGPIVDAVGETWAAIDLALRKGKRRGTPGGDSLPKLLNRCCGIRNLKELPNFTIKQILQWAAAYVARHGQRPNGDSGPIPEAPGETWNAVEHALMRGSRGLRAGTSLAQLFDKYRPQWHSGRGLWMVQRTPRLSVPQILGWADRYYSQHGRRPTRQAGAIAGSAETWHKIDGALKRGGRGLAGCSSLTQLLDQHRPQWAPPRRVGPLTVQQVLRWADRHYSQHGRRPGLHSGAIPGSFDTWQTIDGALRSGRRGLPKGSLSLLLDKHRPQWPTPGPWRSRRAGPLTVKQILKWADQYYAQHGRRPVRYSGAIPGSLEKWQAVHDALRYGRRGFSGGSSLAQFLNKHRPQWPSNRTLPSRQKRP